MRVVLDPLSAELTRETPYPYVRVHRAMGLLAAQGWTPEDAALLVRALAAAGVPLVVPVMPGRPVADPR